MCVRARVRACMRARTAVRTADCMSCVREAVCAILHHDGSLCNQPTMVKCNAQMKCDEHTLCFTSNGNVSETCFYGPVNEAKWSSASAPKYD